MTKSGFEDLLLRFSKGECTKEENLKICRWFERIKVKPDLVLTARERSLVEVKMLMEIDSKIDGNERSVLSKNLFTGLILYAGIAASLVMAGFLIKKYKSTGSLIKNESPFDLNQSKKMSIVFRKAV